MNIYKKIFYALGSVAALLLFIYLGSKYEFVARLLTSVVFITLFIVPIALSQIGSKRKWYKKKRFIIPLILLGVAQFLYPEETLTLSLPLYIIALIYLLLILILLIYSIIKGKD